MFEPIVCTKARASSSKARLAKLPVLVGEEGADPSLFLRLAVLGGKGFRFTGGDVSI